jgi:hypothetical protein
MGPGRPQAALALVRDADGRRSDGLRGDLAGLGPRRGADVHGRDPHLRGQRADGAGARPAAGDPRARGLGALARRGGARRRTPHAARPGRGAGHGAGGDRDQLVAGEGARG